MYFQKYCKIISSFHLGSLKTCKPSPLLALKRILAFLKIKEEQNILLVLELQPMNNFRSYSIK